MVESGTSSALRGWVGVRVLGYGFGLPCAHGPSRAASLMLSIFDADVREANERTTSWIRFWSEGQKSKVT